jgi:GH24 family phage-related lysozyme (muramidase)
MCAMHNLGKQLNQLDTYKSEAIKMSKRSKKFTAKDFEKTWSSCKIYNFTSGSIKYYARLSDKNKYNEICRQSLGEDSKFYSYNEMLLANYVQQVAGDSLVFNRGTSLVGDKRLEMRNIKVLIPKKDYKKIAQEIRSMKRLWRGKNLDGLIERREAEAKLIESCC